MSSAALLIGAVGAVGALALFVLTVRRPPLACALLALAIPLMAGMARGAVVPLLRPNEALLLVVAAGFLVHSLIVRRPLTYTTLDVAVLGFCLIDLVIPWAVILVTRTPATLSDWLLIVGPVQYLLVYVVFSRTQPTPADLRLFFKACMVASVAVAAVAVAQAIDVPGVRDLVQNFYPTAPKPSWDLVYRPSSLLGHYSAVGAFGLINLLLALALAATRPSGHGRWWLALVMGANLLSMVASATYAPLAVLPIGMVAALLVVRRVPWSQLAAGIPVLAVAAVVLWPSISGRVTAQFSGAGGSGLPETLQTRIDYWQAFFVPGLLRHGLWLGTGTIMPPEVPTPLVDFVDNGYLFQLFRAGVPGLAALLVLLTSVAALGWATRTSQDGWERVVGAVCVAGVVSVVALDVTSEYLTFTAVSQEFWMFVGLLSGVLLRTRSSAVPAAQASAVRAGPGAGAAGRVLILPPSVRPRAGAAGRQAGAGGVEHRYAAALPAGRGRLAAVLERFGPERRLVRSSASVLFGFGLARAFGFLFQVTAGRVLSTEGYGRLTYALAVANVASVLLATAPLGLSRFLSRSADSRPEQEAYYVNWLAVVGLLLAVSAIATVAFATPVGLTGWLLVGLLANLLGVAALETYREIQRGLGRYALQSIFYVLANLVQLVVVVVAVVLGWRSPELFLTVYGLSSVAALVLMAPVSRGLRLDGRALRWGRMASIVGFMRPVLLQAIFWNVWFNADLILLQHLRGPAEAGTYAAAKAIATGFTLVPTAIAFVFAPRVARLAEAEVRGHLLRVLAFTAVVTVPLGVCVMLVAGPLTEEVFGGRYAAAALPLVLLLAGVLPYGLKSVLGSLWLGLGHPVVETVSSAAAMAVTLVGGLWLIPEAGAVGAAAAFSAGAVIQLLVDGAVTAWAFGSGAPRVKHLSDGRLLTVEPAATPGREAPGEQRGMASAPVLLVADELEGTPDEAYVAFVRALEIRLSASRPTVLHPGRGHRWGELRAVRVLNRSWELVRAVRLPEVRAGRPAVIVYASRSSLTLPALVRARLLKAFCGGAPLTFVALQSSGRRAALPFFVRWLAPDLLLVPTERARDAARALGIAAETVAGGVDLRRFRPPEPGERAELRRKWRLPAEDSIVLHVGHLRQGRNLGVMASVADLPDVTAVVAASSWRGPGSELVLRELQAKGVVVVDGYLPNVEELYRLADCYVFPTVAPDSAVALPLSILEALASDLPVVSTAFGALSERFGSVPGLTLVDDPELFGELILAACDSGARTRHLVEPFSWDAVAERLGRRLEELEQDLTRTPGVGARRLLAARLRRVIVDRRGVPRWLLWRRRYGYQLRHPSKPAIAVDEVSPDPASAPASAPPPGAARVGLIEQAEGDRRSPVAGAASFLGLPVETAAHSKARRLVDRALAGGWPLIAADVGPAPLPQSLAAFLWRGGTLYLEGLDERSNPALERLGGTLEVTLPQVRRSFTARQLLFPDGVRLTTAAGFRALSPVTEMDVLAWSVDGGHRHAAVVQRQVGRGRIVLSALPRPTTQRPADIMESGMAGAWLVSLLLLRQVYGCRAWHAPLVLANFTIDDPALRRGLLGLRYDLLAAQAEDHHFHATIATVPRELTLADDAVVRRLRQRPEVLSACYHGCDHDGYEFYLTAPARARYRPRPLEEQRAALRRAVDHGRRLAAARDFQLDRVMVFPYGVGPAALFPDLHRLGFLATCNMGDKYPLEAPVPDQPDLGLRPADLAWEGFPVLWRRGLEDDGYLLDLVLGRPVLLFTHLRPLARDFAQLVERARAVNRATRGAAVWRGLDEVARHAYLQRQADESSWEVLMTSNEACLHNPDPEPRTYVVRRPQLAEGSVLEFDGLARDLQRPLQVTVPACGTAVVRVVPRDLAPALSGPRRCTVFRPEGEPAAFPATLEAVR